MQHPHFPAIPFCEVLGIAARSTSPAAASVSARGPLPDNDASVTTDNSSINPNCALGQENAHRDIGVNCASPTAYLPALPFGKKPAPIIRNDISTAGATIAADIAAQHAADAYAAYVRAYALRAQARRDLSAAIAAFWRSSGRLHRQWAAAEARKLGVLERGRSIMLAEWWDDYQRADAAAKGCGS